MTFSYVPVMFGSRVQYWPLLMVHVLNRRALQVAEVFPLVDSGAEHNVFRLDVARDLGLPLSTGEQVIFGGYGSGKLQGVLLEVDMQITLDEKVHVWHAPAIFSKGANKRQVLGQEGFFEFFNIEFRRADREFEIRGRR